MTISLWPTLSYDDAPAGIAFLTDVLGFTEVVRYETDDDDAPLIVHAQLRWPPGGGVMLRSQAAASPELADRPLGAASIYLVTDDPDAVWTRCEEAGTQVVRSMREEDYGSRGFTVGDPEGNLWSIGTYAGEEL